MNSAAELRRIVENLPDIYKAGNIAGYLVHYASDISVCFDGSVMNSDEVRSFITSLFASGGKSLDVQIGGRDPIQFSESGDAAFVSYPWREKFRHADGHVTDTEYRETDVWYRKNGEWRIAYIHLSTTEEHLLPG